MSIKYDKCPKCGSPDITYVCFHCGDIKQGFMVCEVTIPDGPKFKLAIGNDEHGKQVLRIRKGSNPFWKPVQLEVVEGEFEILIEHDC